jgi:hypothetical protein
VGGVGEAEPAGEHARVAGGERARVEAEGGDLGLRDADPDAAADQARVERVVVAIEAQVGLGGDTHDEAAVRLRQRRGQRAHPLALLGEAFGDDRARRAVHACVDALAPAVELVLEVERVGEPAAGLEV